MSGVTECQKEPNSISSCGERAGIRHSAAKVITLEQSSVDSLMMTEVTLLKG